MLCLMCMTQRHRESACDKIPHIPKCSLPSLSLLSLPLLLHRVFSLGDNNALVLHCCNPVTKTAKILAAVALIKAAASSCYAHSHKLEKKETSGLFPVFFPPKLGRKRRSKNFGFGHHSIKFAALLKGSHQ